MGLLDFLKHFSRTEKECRVLVLGLDNSGKTTLLRRINGEDVATVSPTQGFSIQTVVHNNLKLNAWDIGGSIVCNMFNSAGLTHSTKH